MVHPSLELMKRKKIWEVVIDICQEKTICSTGGIKWIAPPEYEPHRPDFYEWVFKLPKTTGFDARKKVYQLRRDVESSSDILSAHLVAEEDKCVPPSTFFNKIEKAFIGEKEADIAIAMNTVSCLRFSCTFSPLFL